MFNTKGRQSKRIWSKFLVIPLAVICLCTLTTIGILKKGLYFNNFSIGNIVVSDFRLILKNRLELEVDSIRINSTGKAFDFQEDLKKIRRVIQVGARVALLCSRIDIRSVAMEGVGDVPTLSIKTQQESWLVNAASKNMQFEAEILHEQNQLKVTINNILIENLRSNGSGECVIDLKKEEIDGKIDVHLAEQLPLTLQFTADKKTIRFHSTEAAESVSVVEIVDLFDLDPDVQVWITDYLQGKKYTLATIQGTIPWDNPMYFFESLNGEVQIDGAEYNLASELPPIKTKFTNTIYNKGILTITPHETTYSGHSTENSWLDINFKDPDNIILTAYIKTLTQFDEDILNLLRYYDIDLPFKQVEGKTAVDLTLSINLSSEDVSATGTFSTSQSSFLWGGNKLGISNATIGIEDSNILVENLGIGIDDTLAFDLTGHIDAAQSSGELQIVMNKFALEVGGQLLTFDTDKPRAVYHIRPENHLLITAPSNWKLGSQNLELDSFTAPISLEDTSVTIPPTQLSSHSHFDATISGTYSPQTQQAEFKGELTRFDYAGVQLDSKKLLLEILHDQDWSIRLNGLSHWSSNEIPLILNETHMKYGDRNFSLQTSEFHCGEFFLTGLSTTYDVSTEQGIISLSNLDLAGDSLGKLQANVKKTTKGLSIAIPKIKLQIDAKNDKSYSAKLSDFAPLHERSSLLQQLKIDKGHLEISSEDITESFTFKASITEPPPILVKDGTLVDKWTISGSSTSEGFSAAINQDMQIRYLDKWLISSENIGYNIPEIISIIKTLSDSSSQKNTDSRDQEVVIDARKSSLFLRQGSEALADKISFTYSDNNSRMHLSYGAGTIDAFSEGDLFQLVGKKLNSTFMDALAREAEFREGEMGIVAYGRFNQFSTIIQINETILESFTALNKILAFVNTVPDLATFSLPGYSTNGLPVTSVLAGALIEDGMATIKSFDLLSPQMTMSGNGWVNLPGNLMEMEFNLTTKAKKKISKIPLFGYIMVGSREVPSITVKVTGDVSDPQVENSMFKEITTLPFSMLYRTLTLPYTLVEPMLNSMKEIEAPEKSFPFGEKKDEDGR